MQAPQIIAIAIISAAAAMLMLLATWAGLSRRHWFLRAAVCSAALIALYPIRAFEPLVWFAAAVPLAAWLSRLTWKRFGGQKILRNRATPRHNGAWQFRLTDFFLAILLAGVVCAVAAALWRERVTLDVRVGGVVLCCVVLHSLCLIVVLSRRWARLLALLLFLFGFAGSILCYAFLLYDSDVAQLLGLVILEQLLPGPDHHGLAVWIGGLLFGTFVALEFAVHIWCAAFSRLLPPGGARPATNMRTKLVPGSAAAVAAVPLLVVYVRMLFGPAIPENPYTGPNSFHEIVAAADEAIDPRHAVNATDPDQRYQKLLTALGKPGHVPLDFEHDTNDAYFEITMQQLQEFRNLSGNLLAESVRAAAAGRYEVASKYAVALIQLGSMLSRGGLIVDTLVGIALEGKGVNGLSQIRHGVSAAEVDSLVRALELVDQSREPIELTFQRDVVFEDQTYDWVHRLEIAVYWALGMEYSRPTDSILANIVKRRDALIRMLIADLAIRRFESERGRLPTDLKTLVPDFMTYVPIDPYSSKPLVYLQSADGPVVYSVGQDGRDDGGRFGTYYEATFEDGFDFDLDALNR